MRPRARARAAPARIGILGGTFDPPHFAHLALAEWARIELRLDRVWFVPAGTPPHKRPGAPSAARHRLAMTRLAVRGNPAFGVSPLECRRRGPSYTVDTLRAFAAAEPRAQLHLIMGADMLATFAHWREPAAIAALATLVVAVRPGARVARRRGLVVLSNPGLEVSSHALRVRARGGRSLRYLVPDAVARYAERHRLYAGSARNAVRSPRA